MLDEKQQKALLDALAELGGKASKEDDVVFEGTKLIVPKGMTLGQAANFLYDRAEAEEKAQNFKRTFRYRPWDGAVCAVRAMEKVFGLVNRRSTFFNAAGSITVTVGPNETIQVPWGGEFTVPMLENTRILFAADKDKDIGMVFTVHVSAPKKLRHHIEGLFIAIEDELASRSIYRGKAFDAQEMPEFLDTAAVNPERIVYSAQVQEELEANVWQVIRDAERQEALGLPLKRSILLAGKYGSGKSEAGRTTAKVAVENGWTFVFVRPGRDSIEDALATARLYQPSVLFIEDADTIASVENGTDGISRLLDMFDGITAKGTRLLCVMTTNHPDKIHAGMLRPGRLDAVVKVNGLDRQGVEKLVRVTIPEGSLDEPIDFDAVYDAAAGYTPAFIKEACDRATRFALVHEAERGMLTITTEDLVHAAKSLRLQFEAMEEAPEHQDRDPVSVALTRIVKGAIAEMASKEIPDWPFDEDGDRIEAALIDAKAVEEAKAAKNLAG